MESVKACKEARVTWFGHVMRRDEEHIGAASDGNAGAVKEGGGASKEQMERQHEGRRDRKE